ncbi:hypothetical protein RhiJN_27129 [Ceratobasidium sp. AG-Ba]|nr:hypothetical protein RhiJN_27129 [Ceratobasidium sp. AG-Ba]
MNEKRPFEDDKSSTGSSDASLHKYRRVSESGDFASCFQYLNRQECKAPPATRIPAPTKSIFTLYHSPSHTPIKSAIRRRPAPSPLAVLNPLTQTYTKIRIRPRYQPVFGPGVQIGTKTRRLVTFSTANHVDPYVDSSPPANGSKKLCYGPRHNLIDKANVAKLPFLFGDATTPTFSEVKQVMFNDTQTIFELPRYEPDMWPTPSPLRQGQDTVRGFMDDEWNVRDRSTFEILAHRPHLAKKGTHGIYLRDQRARAFKHPPSAPESMLGRQIQDQFSAMRKPNASRNAGAPKIADIIPVPLDKWFTLCHDSFITLPTTASHRAAQATELTQSISKLEIKDEKRTFWVLAPEDRPHKSLTLCKANISTVVDLATGKTFPSDSPEGHQALVRWANFWSAPVMSWAEYQAQERKRKAKSSTLEGGQDKTVDTQMEDLEVEDLEMDDH